MVKFARTDSIVHIPLRCGAAIIVPILAALVQLSIAVSADATPIKLRDGTILTASTDKTRIDPRKKQAVKDDRAARPLAVTGTKPAPLREMESQTATTLTDEQKKLLLEQDKNREDLAKPPR